METVRYKGQNYKSIRNQLRRRSEKFVDAEFPGAAATTDWLRPTELVKRPRLITDGISGDDATPGDRGSVWFATACSVLTARPDLIALTIPRYARQDYGGKFHPGIFLFAFARQGRVYEVVVDDRLPARDNSLLRCRSADGKEFWSALLEKAYAKFHGGYETLGGGRIADAIASFGRGIPDHWDLRLLRTQVDADNPAVQERLAQLLRFHIHWDSLVLFSLRPEAKINRTNVTHENLVYGRGYLLVAVQQLRTKEGVSVWLLKLQTARFEDGLDWTGPWRDGGIEWHQLDADSTWRTKSWFKVDGSFWISMSDALSRFTDLDMCLARAGGRIGRTLPAVTLEGAWNPGLDVGGTLSAPDDLLDGQPQFLLRVRGDSSQTVTLCLEQGGRNAPEAACRLDLQSEVGLDLLKVEDNLRCRLARGGAYGAGGSFVARAEPQRQPVVTMGACLAPGCYLVVPRRPPRSSGRQPEDMAVSAFTLRAFSRLGFELSPLPEAPQRGSCSGSRRHMAVSRLVVEQVSGLSAWLPDADKLPVKVRLQVTCENSDVKQWQSGYYFADPSGADSFLADLRLLIHRYRLGEPVRVEVFYSRIGSNTKTPVGWISLGESSTPNGQDSALIGSDGQPISVWLRCSLCTLNNVGGF